MESVTQKLLVELESNANKIHHEELEEYRGKQFATFEEHPHNKTATVSLMGGITFNRDEQGRITFKEPRHQSISLVGAQRTKTFTPGEHQSQYGSLKAGEQPCSTGFLLSCSPKVLNTSGKPHQVRHATRKCAGIRVH